jgi:hypothetical protein
MEHGSRGKPEIQNLVHVLRAIPLLLAGSGGVRHTDAMATNEARGLFIAQRKELAELALKYYS